MDLSWNSVVVLTGSTPPAPIGTGLFAEFGMDSSILDSRLELTGRGYNPESTALVVRGTLTAIGSELVVEGHVVHGGVIGLSLPQTTLLFDATYFDGVYWYH